MYHTFYDMDLDQPKQVKRLPLMKTLGHIQTAVCLIFGPSKTVSKQRFDVLLDKYRGPVLLINSFSGLLT